MKCTTVKFSEIAADENCRLDSGYWISKKEKEKNGNIVKIDVWKQNASGEKTLEISATTYDVYLEDELQHVREMADGDDVEVEISYPETKKA